MLARMRRRATLTALLIAIGAMASACTAAPPDEEPPPAPQPSAEAIRMAAVGDSITDADSVDIDGGIPGPESWVSYAVGADLEFVGGWAEWGATTERMTEAMGGPFDADVLVILAGTNDVSWSTPVAEIGENLSEIAEHAGIADVVLSSVPPNDFAAEETTALNEYLERFAAESGWHWVDAAAGLRDGDRFAAGMSDDGVHPTEQGARLLGEAIGQAVAAIR